MVRQDVVINNYKYIVDVYKAETADLIENRYAEFIMLRNYEFSNNIINAIQSITDDVIPITFINFDIPFVFHFFGFLKNSSSTLSYGIPICEKSYIKSWISIWIGNNGKNGKIKGEIKKWQ